VWSSVVTSDCNCEADCLGQQHPAFHSHLLYNCVTFLQVFSGTFEADCPCGEGTLVDAEKVSPAVSCAPV
jgi:hypothetical protein